MVRYTDTPMPNIVTGRTKASIKMLNAGSESWWLEAMIR